MTKISCVRYYCVRYGDLPNRVIYNSVQEEWQSKFFQQLFWSNQSQNLKQQTLFLQMFVLKTVLIGYKKSHLFKLALKSPN